MFYFPSNKIFVFLGGDFTHPHCSLHFPLLPNAPMFPNSQKSLLNNITYLGEYSYRDDEDVHTVATLLKRYFREMQAPILTFELYPTFIAADSEVTCLE